MTACAGDTGCAPGVGCRARYRVEMLNQSWS
jgi:hypothetical protein